MRRPSARWSPRQSLNEYVCICEEYRWALVVSILLLAFGSIPIIAGYAAQTSDQRFIGTFYDAPDYAVHMAMLHYGEQGGWDYQLTLHNRTANHSLCAAVYVLLGQLDRLIHLPAAILFQSGPTGIWPVGLPFHISLIGTRLPDRRPATASFPADLTWLGGWLAAGALAWVPSKVAPVDLWLIDAYPLFSIDLFPHFAATIAALAIAITAFLDYSHHQGWQNLVIIAACGLFVQIINPIAFILADLAMAGILIFASCKSAK